MEQTMATDTTDVGTAESSLTALFDPPTEAVGVAQDADVAMPAWAPHWVEGTLTYELYQTLPLAVQEAYVARHGRRPLSRAERRDQQTRTTRAQAKRHAQKRAAKASRRRNRAR